MVMPLRRSILGFTRIRKGASLRAEPAGTVGTIMLRFTLCLAALLAPAVARAQAPMTLMAYAGIFRDNYTSVVGSVRCV